MHDRGTNRGQFARGEVDHYTWIGEGSNYLMNEPTAAFLWGQFERADAVTAERSAIWSAYWDAFEDLEARGLARRPIVPTSASTTPTSSICCSRTDASATR